MKPQLFALITAMAWGIGGYFEKKGLHMGHLPPQLGITVRTAVALIILGAVSFNKWPQLTHAGTKSILLMVIGGGVIAGSIGMLSFYIAIKGAPLSRVMPIAFTSPLFGALMGLIFAGEQITTKGIIGILMTVGGIVLLTV
jgi:transporter family protein